MGCGVSHNVYDDPKVIPLKPLFEALDINENCIQKLYNIFRICDASEDGLISDIEVMVLLGMGNTPFMERVFRIFDTDNSGELDFKEFVLAVYNYCTLGKEFLPYFAFSLYDLDAEDSITIYETQQMLRDIYGKSYDKNLVAVELAKTLQVRYGKSIDIKEFLHFSKANDRFLFPVYQVVSKLQEKFLGAKYWEKLIDDRVSFSNGKYVRFEDLLEKKYTELAKVEEEHPSNKIRRKSIAKTIGQPIIAPKRNTAANIKRISSPVNKKNSSKVHLGDFQKK